jgi:FkbM family methyltransferase
VFRVEPIVVAHVGAHLGEEAQSYIEINWLDTYWFEANPDMLSNLIANPDIDKNKIVMRAMTNITGQKIRFNVATSSMSSSIFAFQKHLDVYPDIKVEREIDVITLRLDDFFQDFVPDLINLDIQGSELLALKGAENILKRVRWIYTEVSFTELYDSGVLVGDIDSFLKQFGFERSGTRRLYGEGWGDAIYINTNLCRLPFKNRVREKISSAIWIKNQIIYQVRLQASIRIMRKGIR